LQGITADHYEEAKGLATATSCRCRSPSSRTLPQPGLPVFQDPAVREALYTAWTSRPSSTASITACRRHRILPAERILAHNPNLPKQSYDPDKAKQILDAAGWTWADACARRTRAPGVRQLDTAGNHVREQAQQLLQQNWLEIGQDDHQQPAPR